jgi:hypothetical protein
MKTNDKKIPGKRRRRCEICNMLKYGVTKLWGRIIKDVRGKEHEEAICPECYKDLLI